MIYDTFFGQRQDSKNSVLTADAAMQVANILEEQSRLNEAYKFVKIASQTYTEEYGSSSDNTIIAVWLQLQIAYTQNTGNAVIEMADSLFHALAERDKQLIDKFHGQMSEDRDNDSDARVELKYKDYDS
mmetsp:Transcript_4475/g.6678  ORF Transcript_4475/g.6678 Transcript_4475/m.6678 type:complete len:129 (-) Transcript_4475:611-997(-)